MIDLGTSTEIFGCFDRARARAARRISYLVDLYGRRPLDAEYLALLVAEDERGAVAQHLVALQALHDDAVGSHRAECLLLGLLGSDGGFVKDDAGTTTDCPGCPTTAGVIRVRLASGPCRGEASFSQPRALVRVSSRPKVWLFPPFHPHRPSKSALLEPTKPPRNNLSEGVGGHSRRRLPSPAPESSFERRMGKRKNRSKAMLRAAKRRGHVAGKSAAAADGAGASPSIANPNKKVFGDDDDAGTGDARQTVNVPPPPAAPSQHQLAEKIVLPSTTAPWFSRTLDGNKPTHFEEYYRRQAILPDEEWGSFLSHLRKPLPVTFRMSNMASHANGVAEALAEGKHLLRPRQQLYNEVTGRPIPPPKELRWCNGWQLGCDKMALKYSRTPELREFQRWLVKYNSTGVLTRQAVDSMVPAAILGVEPHHLVLDMCASPGSKTTQCIEQLNANNTGAGSIPTGCVVANDINPRRAYFLVRRCAALGAATGSLMVTNHHAQWFPNPGVPIRTLPEGIQSACAGGGLDARTSSRDPAPAATREDSGRYPEGVYDRIICDVPCSGDGTLRKNPQIWSEWRPEFAMGLHQLQLRIAQRGAALLKVGGYMVYSTCSFNPVENEAVVAELVRRCGGALEIVDASDRVADLKRRPGMKHWRVVTMVDDETVEYPTYEDSQKESVSVGLRRKFERSMWPPKSGVTRLGKRIKGPPLERCMRLMPHLQDMGGFFATLLKKVAPLPGPNEPTRAGVARAMSTREEGTGAGAGPFGSGTGGAPRRRSEHAYSPASTSLVESLRREWGGTGTWESEFAAGLHVRSDTNRALTYLSPGVRAACVDRPGAARIKCVWSGVKVFEKRGTALGERREVITEGAEGAEGADGRGPVTADGVSAYRLTQEGAAVLADHVGDDRKFALPARDLKQLLKEPGKEIPLKSFTPAVANAARSVRPGSVIVELRKAGGGGAAEIDDSCPPLAVELTAGGGLKVDWRYRKGLEGAPKAAAAAILRRLDGPSRGYDDYGGDEEWGEDDDQFY